MAIFSMIKINGLFILTFSHSKCKSVTMVWCFPESNYIFGKTRISFIWSLSLNIVSYTEYTFCYLWTRTYNCNLMNPDFCKHYIMYTFCIIGNFYIKATNNQVIKWSVLLNQRTTTNKQQTNIQTKCSFIVWACTYVLKLH